MNNKTNRTSSEIGYALYRGSRQGVDLVHPVQTLSRRERSFPRETAARLVPLGARSRAQSFRMA